MRAGGNPNHIAAKLRYDSDLTDMALDAMEEEAVIETKGAGARGCFSMNGGGRIFGGHFSWRI